MDVPAPAPAAPAMEAMHKVITVSLYKLRMPFGSVSRDESFWKLVNEDIVNVAMKYRLEDNGLRIGRARVADWTMFLDKLVKAGALKIIDGRISSQPAIGDAPLDMSDQLREETIWYFDEHGLSGRSYDDCINRFSLAFQWAPRQPDTIRMTICPVVHSLRTRFDYALSDNPEPTPYLQEDNYYDLHLTTDIPPGEFLIVGTSPQTQDPNRIGSRFLTRDGKNQRFEEMLVFVGKPVAINRLKAPRPATQPAGG